MAVTIKEISAWLNESDTKHKVIEEKSKIIFGIGNEESNKSIIIELEEDGELFQMYMNLLDEDNSMVRILDNKHLGIVLQHILYLNYKTKFGTWEFDPGDGEVRLAVEIPLEDAKMTQKQFNRIYGYFFENGQVCMNELSQILKTGEVPSDQDDSAAMLRRLIEMMKDTENDEDGI